MGIKLLRWFTELTVFYSIAFGRIYSFILVLPASIHAAVPCLLANGSRLGFRQILTAWLQTAYVF